MRLSLTLGSCLFATAGLVLLSACGGSSDSSGTASSPTRLFPKDVMSGTINFGDERQLSISLTYANNDYTQGITTYTGAIQAAPNTNGSGNNASDSFTGNNMRQTGETEPGRLVFYFDGAHAPLQGRLVLELVDVDTTAHPNSYTGKVEGSTELYFSKEQNATRTRLNLSDATITIIWAAESH